MKTIYISHAAALAAYAAAQNAPARPGWHWDIRKIPGMQMWTVCQFWDAATPH